MKVLIVDDSRAMRMIVKRTLGQTDIEKCEVVEAGNGAEALQKAASENPDFILCDWNMPQMSGIDFLRELRASGSNVVFGFITSEGGAEIRHEALEAGAQFVLTKPFTAESLNAVLPPCFA